MVLHRLSQLLSLIQHFRAPNAALLLRAAHEYVARVFDMEEVETKPVLGEDKDNYPTRTLFPSLSLPLLQLLHRSLHHLLKLVSGYAKRFVDVLQRPFHHGLVR